MTAFVVKNENDSGLGLIEDALTAKYSQVDIVSRECPDSLRLNDRHELVLLLGSSWSTYWDSVQTEVRAEQSLVIDAVWRDLPILGICYGAQIISSAFGGTVTRMTCPEVGWSNVESTGQCSVFEGRWMQWHYDSFTAPYGFEVLATNSAGVQAIRRGRSLGVQFHPEANEAVVTKWMEGDGVAELAALGISPSALLEETRREVSRTTVATRELIEWFLENVAQGSTAHRSGN